MAEGTFSDVWDEEDDHQVGENNFWSRMKSNRLTDGYKEGLSQGQDEALQRGFNKAYQMESMRTYEVAKIRGVLSAVVLNIKAEWSSKYSITCTEDWIKRAEKLISEIRDFEVSSKYYSEVDDMPNVMMTCSCVDTDSSTKTSTSHCKMSCDDKEKALQKQTQIVIGKSDSTSKHIKTFKVECISLLKEAGFPVALI